MIIFRVRITPRTSKCSIQPDHSYHIRTSFVQLVFHLVSRVRASLAHADFDARFRCVPLCSTQQLVALAPHTRVSSHTHTNNDEFDPSPLEAMTKFKGSILSRKLESDPNCTTAPLSPHYHHSQESGQLWNGKQPFATPQVPSGTCASHVLRVLVRTSSRYCQCCQCSQRVVKALSECRATCATGAVVVREVEALSPTLLTAHSRNYVATMSQC